MFQLVKRNTEEDKTVHWKIAALWGGKKVELRETQRAVGERYRRARVLKSKHSSAPVAQLDRAPAF